MGKLIKGVIVYTGVLIGIALVAGFLALGAMFFTAGNEKPIQIFGYRFISENKPRDDIRVDSVASNNPELHITNGGFPIQIVQDQTKANPNIVIKKSDNIFGIIKNEYIRDVAVRVDGNKVFIDIPKHDGFVSYSRSVVSIVLPADSKKYDINVNSDSGKILIDGKMELKTNDGKTTELLNERLLISELNIETNTANFDIQNIGELKAATDNNDIATNFEKIKLKTKTGSFDFSGIKHLKVEQVADLDEGISSNFELIAAKKTNLKFNNLYSPVTINAEDIRIVANVVNTLGKGLSFNSEKGYFNIKEIVSVSSDSEINSSNITNTITAKKTNIIIDKIDNGTTNINTTYGNITINEIYGTAGLTTIEGNIKVNKITGVIEAKSNIGDIVVKDYMDSAVFTNNKGKINATFKAIEENELLIENTKTIVVTGKGEVRLSNITENIDVKTTSKANVIVNYKTLKAQRESKFEIAGGKLELQIPSGNGFAATYVGVLKNVSGQVAGVELSSVLKPNTKVIVFGTEAENVMHFDINLKSGKLNFLERII